MKLRERVSKFCIRVSDWFAHPIFIFLFPVLCAVYIIAGGAEGRLTLILSVLAITLTQMVLNAQNVDTESMKLQMAELVRATPTARNIVIDTNLSIEDMKKMEEEIQNAITNKVQLAEERGTAT